MITEAIVLILGYYLFCSLCFYGYGVLKTWEFTKIWNFNVKDGYVGICKYPKWSLFWVEWIVRRVRNGR